MKNKIMLKISVDIGMTVILLLLMTYELIGQAVHEWLGMGIFILFIIHHILNSKWSRNLGKGKYPQLRILQTMLVSLVFVSMIGSMISGIILSRHVLAFFPVNGGRAFGRLLHMLSSYWGFLLMAVHLGFHRNVMINMAGKNAKEPSVVRTLLLRIFGLLTAVYGILAFIKRDIGSYLLMRTEFVFFDFEEPLLFFLFDYLCIMGLFIWIGHYFTIILKWHGRKKND